jgi:hypothetical protein
LLSPSKSAATAPFSDARKSRRERNDARRKDARDDRCWTKSFPRLHGRSLIGNDVSLVNVHCVPHDTKVIRRRLKRSPWRRENFACLQALAAGNDLLIGFSHPR